MNINEITKLFIGIYTIKNKNQTTICLIFNFMVNERLKLFPKKNSITRSFFLINFALDRLYIVCVYKMLMKLR